MAGVYLQVKGHETETQSSDNVENGVLCPEEEKQRQKESGKSPAPLERSSGSGRHIPEGSMAPQTRERAVPLPACFPAFAPEVWAP